MTWIEEVRAAKAALTAGGYAALTQRELIVLAYAWTATANVAIPRGLENR